jgi:hypothetical protein
MDKRRGSYFGAPEYEITSTSGHTRIGYSSHPVNMKTEMELISENL